MLADRIGEAVEQGIIRLIEDSTVGDLVFPVSEEQVAAEAENICLRFGVSREHAPGVTDLLNAGLDRYWEGVA